MYNYLDKFKILYDYQFGFRKNYSTSVAVIDVVNMIQNQLYNGKYVMGVFMDLQKAFDTVNFNILIDKLEHYGIRGNYLNWFKSYLIGRTQFAVINDAPSNIRTTTCGIPQGTVLGPLLFLLYINDIANAVTDSQIKLFADDSNMFIIGDNPKSLFDRANKDLSNLSRWINVNKLHINYDKTNFMIFEPKFRINNNNNYNTLTSMKLFLNGNEIQCVHSVKYLGVIIDDQLNWTDHIKHVTSKVSSMIGIMYRNNHFLPPYCKKNIYFALIHSVLIYCIEVYANVNKSQLKPLIIKCNRLLRLLQNKPRRTHAYELYALYNTLPVDFLFQFYTMNFIHKCSFNPSTMPCVVSGWFVRGSRNHSHNTRHKDNFVLQSNLNPKSVMYYGPSMWSKLPSQLQSISSSLSFLKLYKLYLIDGLK